MTKPNSSNLISSKPISSMTGYARSSVNILDHDIIIEIKSVNSRGLDIRLRAPSNLDALEQKIRKKANAVITRGSVNISINVKKQANGSELAINQQALDAVIKAIKNIKGRIKTAKSRPEAILALKNVLEQKENLLDEKEQKQFEDSVFESFESCLGELIISRQTEGNRLEEIIFLRLNEIEKLTIAAKKNPSRSRDAIAQKLQLQISQLSEASPILSIERLNQEALILATKADILEEIDRLFAHVKAARELITNGGIVGRKLDFLSQEFNREANTLCSKSNAIDLTTIGLDLKTVIDQLREQVQNIE
jgi:uncharacterized protein (TIGR00255 family)